MNKGGCSKYGESGIPLAISKFCTNQGSSISHAIMTMNSTWIFNHAPQGRRRLTDPRRISLNLHHIPNIATGSGYTAGTGYQMLHYAVKIKLFLPSWCPSIPLLSYSSCFDRMIDRPNPHQSPLPSIYISQPKLGSACPT